MEIFCKNKTASPVASGAANTNPTLPTNILTISSAMSSYSMTSVKFLKMNSGKLGKSAMTAWFVGIVFSLIYFLRKLYLNLNSENRIKKSESNPQLAIESKIQIKKERQAIVLGIIKNLGDLVPASNGANVPQLLFKKSFTDKWIGLGGLISALISCYQAWP